jgi:acetyltransferase-like isoleucine patch superfamily enzyme
MSISRASWSSRREESFRTFVGHLSTFSVAKSIEVGEDVLIASGCWISDYSPHPVDPAKRAAGLQVSPEEVRPVRIGNRVWLGSRAIILPGVTVGDDAVVGAGAVVTKDVPPGSICVGNPGRILSKTVYDSRTTAV